MTSTDAPRSAPASVTAAPAARFPLIRFNEAGAYVDAYVAELTRAAASIERVGIDRAAEILLRAYCAGATVFSCGNGGSASVANHLECDHVKGIRSETDLWPRVVSLSTNVELLTAIANDLGYEDVFCYQLESYARPGDVVLAVSSSGGSPNIVRALAWAKEHGLHTIAFTGFAGGAARDLVDASVHVDCANYGVVEDLHQAAMHAIAQYIRQSRMDEATVAATVF
jgi:phosphoheptose isomerase